MGSFKIVLATVFAVQVLVGCSDSSDSTEDKPTGVIPQYQLDAMKKAQDVEKVMEEAEQQRREQMDVDSI